MTVQKRNQYWDTIAAQYNARAESGFRTVKQLKTAYYAYYVVKKQRKIQSNDKVNFFVTN